MGGVKRVFAGRLCIHQLHHADEYNGSPWLNRKGFPMQIAAMFVNYYNSGERQTMYHLMTCGDARNCMWTNLAIQILADVNCAKHWEESI